MVHQQNMRESNTKKMKNANSSCSKIIKQKSNKKLLPTSFDFDVVNFTNNQCMFATSRQRRAPVQAYEQVLVLQPQALVHSHVEMPPTRKQRKHRLADKIIETSLPALQTETATTCATSSCCSISSSSNASGLQLPSSHGQFMMISYNNNEQEKLNDNRKTSSSSSRIHRSSISIRELLN